MRLPPVLLRSASEPTAKILLINSDILAIVISDVLQGAATIHVGAIAAVAALLLLRIGR